jgi:hypothetical protein
VRCSTNAFDCWDNELEKLAEVAPEPCEVANGEEAFWPWGPEVVVGDESTIDGTPGVVDEALKFSPGPKLRASVSPGPLVPARVLSFEVGGGLKVGEGMANPNGDDAPVVPEAEDASFVKGC